jgi:hypothetical protein
MKALLVMLCFCSFASVAHAIDLPFTKDLFEGMSNSEEVYRLSIVLKKEGFYAGDLTKTFSPALARSVSSFQAKKGIVPINGIVGTKTRYELNKIVLGWLGKNAPSTPPAQNKAVGTSAVVTPQKSSNPTVKSVPTVASVASKKTVTAVQSCVHRGKTYKHGEKVRLYKYTVARAGGKCPSMVRVCNDGQLDGDLSYRHHTCTIPTVGTDAAEPKTPAVQKQPTLDDTKTTDTTTQPKTTPKTQPKDGTPQTKGCKSGVVQYQPGATTQGCIGPGRSDPTPGQCLAAIMPVYKCEQSGNWTCVTNCQHNYY